MKKLFEPKKRVIAVGAPDAKIIFTKAPFAQYEQFLLDKNLRQYIDTIMILKKILRTGVQRTPQQRTYEMSVGSDSINVEFVGSNNLIGSKFLLFTTKATKRRQYMTATTLNLPQK